MATKAQPVNDDLPSFLRFRPIEEMVRDVQRGVITSPAPEPGAFMGRKAFRESLAEFQKSKRR